MNDLPGYDIEEVFGEVFGLSVRSPNLGSQVGAGLKSLLGGERHSKVCGGDRGQRSKRDHRFSA
jgi:uncharacterized protein YbjQ (UPF0145 family)